MNSTRLVVLFALLSACGGAAGAQAPIDLSSCPESSNQTELFRIDGASKSVRVTDLGAAITVDYARRFHVVDNCGEERAEFISTSGPLSNPAGAVYVGGQLVLCRNEELPDGGIFTLLEDGTPGEQLEIGLYCPGSADFAAEGFVASEDRVTQHFPDGSTRSSPTGRTVHLSRQDETVIVADQRRGGVAVFGPGGNEPVMLELPEPVFTAIPQHGIPSSSWTVMAPLFATDTPAYAVDLSTGEWVATVSMNFEAGQPDALVSARDGLVATRWIRLSLVRPGWDEPLEGTTRYMSGLAVVDTNRVLILTEEEDQMLQVPLDFPGESDDSYEVLWTRPHVEGEAEGLSVGSGVVWNDVVLFERYFDSDLPTEVWAHPLDGSAPYPFLPAVTDAYYGEEYVTAMGPSPDTPDEFRIFRKRLGGELEVIDEQVVNGRGNAVLEARRWTPWLGRIVYAVFDGSQVSIRQHRLED